MKSLDSLVVVMPAWNEEAGITDFLLELRKSLGLSEILFIVVDDASTDNSIEKLQSLESSGFPLQIYRNSVNLGHGPSTLKALELGLSENPKYIISIDGDGQFLGEDVKRVFCLIQEGNCSIVEGIRISRGDPFYRKLVTRFTKALVFSKSFQIPRDANTPLRAYTRESLAILLQSVNDQSLIPNLMFSATSRRLKMSITQTDVKSIPRRGGDEIGSTWGQGFKFLPTKRFLLFCLKAFKQWLVFDVRQMK
jgi:glycosyltransferase involved in cell wall biosynthesis